MTALELKNINKNNLKSMPENWTNFSEAVRKYTGAYESIKRYMLELREEKIEEYLAKEGKSRENKAALIEAEKIVGEKWVGYFNSENNRVSLGMSPDAISLLEKRGILQEKIRNPNFLFKASMKEKLNKESKILGGEKTIKYIYDFIYELFLVRKEDQKTIPVHGEEIDIKNIQLKETADHNILLINAEEADKIANIVIRLNPTCAIADKNEHGSVFEKNGENSYRQMVAKNPVKKQVLSK